ncbi:hypothetical protein [Phaeovulum sp.]|uniref:hypothetical protein n=1 Tax=Phaeovulum sp. TaxID=2934796 RepID=UPI0039E6DA0C
MRNPINDILTSLSQGVSNRLRDAVGNAAILAMVALLALTAWVVCIAGLVTVLAPLWGMATALFIVALVIIIVAFVLLAVLKRRTRLQRVRAAIDQSEARRKATVAVLAALPRLLRRRSAAALVISGLAIGAMIIAALKSDDKA